MIQFHKSCFHLTFMTKGAEAVLKGQNEKVDQFFV